MTQSAKRFTFSLAISVAVALVISGAFWLGVFKTWQTKLADKLFLNRPSSGQIVIAAIDESSLQALGQWPWPRAVHGQAIKIIAQGQPKAIGYDVIFSEPSGIGVADDQALAQALAGSPVVLPVEGAPLQLRQNQFPLATKVIRSIETISQPAKNFGHVNVLSDEDGVVRTLPVFIDSGQEKIPAMSLAVSSFYSGQTIDDLANQTGPALRINFIGPPGSFKTISFKDVYDGKISPEVWRGKIVLVGVTSADLHDSQATPMSLGQLMPGVEIHANAVETIIAKSFLKDISSAGAIAIIFILSLVCALSFSLNRRIWLAALGSLVAYLIYLGVALWAFDKGLIFNLVYPSLAFVGSLLATLSYQYFSETKEKRHLRQSFQHYLSPHVIAEIVKNPQQLKLGGQKRDMSVLFSDIRGFTTLSEKLAPEKLVAFLNEYFTAMTDIVLSRGGVLDKFMGDGLMAFWGAPQDMPDHAQQACWAALEMSQKLAELKQEWAAKGLPDINIGVGINSGQMVVGNMGSSQRFDYTALGDNVNLGSRLEGLNKQYQTQIIISQFTFERAKDQFNCRFLDKVKVKGKEIPVEIYELTGQRAGNDI